MFLDEPTSGLDPVAAHEVLGLIDALRERGVTVFLTTHRLDEAERLCDRVAIMNTSLRTIGRPDELRRGCSPGRWPSATAAPLAQARRGLRRPARRPGLAAAEPDTGRRPARPSAGPAGTSLTVSDPARPRPR